MDIADQAREDEIVMEVERLKSLRVALKSGEYNGVDIMKAWTAIDELIEAISKIEDLEQQVENLGYEVMDALERG